MDIVRSCYESEWRFFPGHPEILTKGRYVFSPPGTPFFPKFHLFGSRNWTQAPDQERTVLGESREAVHKWSDGAWPIPFPLAQQIGSDDCLSKGELQESAGPWSFTSTRSHDWTESLDGNLALDLGFLFGCGGFEGGPQESFASRNFVLIGSADIPFTWSGEVHPNPGQTIRVELSIDGATVSTFTLTGGPFSISSVITIPPGFHKLGVKWKLVGT